MILDPLDMDVCILPESVNLTAFPSRFRNICVRRYWSIIKTCGMLLWILKLPERFFLVDELQSYLGTYSPFFAEVHQIDGVRKVEAPS